VLWRAIATAVWFVAVLIPSVRALTHPISLVHRTLAFTWTKGAREATTHPVGCASSLRHMACSDSCDVGVPSVIFSEEQGFFGEGGSCHRPIDGAPGASGGTVLDLDAASVSDCGRAARGSAAGDAVGYSHRQRVAAHLSGSPLGAPLPTGDRPSSPQALTTDMDDAQGFSLHDLHFLRG
jgi:hypothetical protein